MSWKFFVKDLRRIGRYDVLANVGKGGMGSVYKARCRDTGAVVAVKVVRPEVAKDPSLCKRFEQEFLATRALADPHIVRGLEFGQDGGLPYLVMEYVDGKSLWDRVQAQGRLPEAEALDLIAQVARALHVAHEQGLIHRDVKPDNILVTADGRAKLTDFGLVKDLDGGLDLTGTASRLGGHAELHGPGTVAGRPEGGRALRRVRAGRYAVHGGDRAGPVLRQGLHGRDAQEAQRRPDAAAPVGA